MTYPVEPTGVVAGLVRTAFLVDAVYTESAREYGLTRQQGQLLCVLMARTYGLGELGTTLRLAKSSVTGLVDRSERNDLVRREPDPRDTRGTRVALTPRGSRVAAEFYADACRRIEDLTARLGGPDRDALAALLARVVHDNEVPMVFTDPDDGAGSGCGS